MTDLMDDALKSQVQADSIPEIPTELPILTLKDIVIYPQMRVPLIISDEKGAKLIDDVLVKDRLLGLVAQKNTDVASPKAEDLYEYGTASIVLTMLKFPDGTTRIIVQGLSRMRVDSYTKSEPYLVAKIQKLQDEVEDSIEVSALARNATNLFSEIVSLIPQLPDELKIMAMNIDDPGKLADMMASNINISLAEREEILEALNVKERLTKLTTFLNRELEVTKLGSKIQDDVKSEMDKTQREYYLRQQLKAIQEELGETDERTAEINELKEKIKEAKLPAEAQKEADRELDRLAKMPPAAAEYTVARTYIDWLINLPWAVTTEDNLDIPAAEKVLDEDHYDLEKVKGRILEYLAVRKLKPDMKGPILCFVGPPGTGKTSLGKSIARALGRKFMRISLGGVRDEAEIRGHRRTYVGALPGRIIQGLRKAGSNNPIFMLDEIDKLGSDFRGDPSSALLEVLDPEQNFSFSDHYLDVPFDLSKVMFITTANILDTIPPALRDRMETLELPGYTEDEKVSIAEEYLVPKQLNEHGLTAERLTFDDAALRAIARDYTREAGLRNLEREIATVCRKVAKEIASGKDQKFHITKDKIHEYLGPIKYFSEIADRTSDPGVATGLAWTQAGGDILFIESTKMPGNGKLTMTGQLGDVMKESAQAALSFVRSRADSLEIDLKDFGKQDIHIHVPAGAIPKDGPSAGVTMAMSLVSLFRGQPIRSDVAMTGEITLRGRVMPVGGIKEKVLAAKQAGIKTIVLPKNNEKDLVEVPPKAKEEMVFQFVEKVDEMLPIVFEDSHGKK